jgi:enoyl-CoA hydratase/carnithine racemase
VTERSAFWTMRTPIIGAINGAAVGAGLTVPMLFDLRIVADDAKLGFVFARRGIVPDANICWLLPRLVGVRIGMELELRSFPFTTDPDGTEVVAYAFGPPP